VYVDPKQGINTSGRADRALAGLVEGEEPEGADSDAIG
jgi:hypothetical protein